LSKFDRYKKTTDDYIFPHKHCKRCNEMIEEAYTYCPSCYVKISEKKQRKWYMFWKRGKKEESESKEQENKEVEEDAGDD